MWDEFSLKRPKLWEMGQQFAVVKYVRQSLMFPNVFKELRLHISLLYQIKQFMKNMYFILFLHTLQLGRHFCTFLFCLIWLLVFLCYKIQL